MMWLAYVAGLLTTPAIDIILLAITILCHRGDRP